MSNLCTLTPGCGWGSDLISAPGNVLVIPLSPDHPVSESLKDTAFTGAQSLIIDRSNGSFRLVFPDDNRSLSGQFVRVGDSWEMTNLYFESNGQAGEMALDPITRQVTEIKTAQGATWNPSKPATASARLQAENRLESYLASNDELLSMTRHDPKQEDAAFGFIPFVFFTIMIIWMLCADGILPACPGFLPIFAFIAAILGTVPPPPPAELPAPNNPPDARDDAFSIIAGSTLGSEVLTDHGSGADSDPDGNALSTTLVTGPTNGTVMLGTDGSFTYTPGAGFVGTETFVYQLSDGNGGTDNATVTITMTNQPPDAKDDDLTFFAESMPPLHSGNLFANNGSGVDSDPDGQTFTIIAINGSAANVGVPILTVPGTFTVFADGSFTYDDSGFDPTPYSFTYTISDGFGGTDTATVTFTVINLP